MIKPLLNMTIKGAIWYQGESNQGDPLSFQDPQGLPMAQYGCHFPSMIADCESVVPWCAREGKHAVYVRPPLTQLNDGAGGGERESRVCFRTFSSQPPHCVMAAHEQHTLTHTVFAACVTQ